MEKAFAETDAVQVIFLDYAVQARLYKWAKQRGTPEADLEHIFQYPRGRNALAGVETTSRCRARRSRFTVVATARFAVGDHITASRGDRTR